MRTPSKAAKAEAVRTGDVFAKRTQSFELFRSHVHVLHAFQKKSKSGIKTPRADVELVETRLKAVLGSHRSERG
jgi:phage-related protein